MQVFKLQDARPSLPEHLAYLWTTLLQDAEWIIRRAGGVTLKQAGLVPESGGIRVKDAVDAFLRFTDKPIIASRAAVTDGLAQACRDGLIGIGRGPSPSNLQSRQDRETPVVDPTEEGLWIVPPAPPSEAAAGSSGSLESTAPAISHGDSAATASPTAAVTGKPLPAKTVTKFVVKGGVPVESWSDVFRSFVGPAARMQLKQLKLGVEFELLPGSDTPLAANDPRLESMREAARQLGLEIVED